MTAKNSAYDTQIAVSTGDDDDVAAVADDIIASAPPVVDRGSVCFGFECARFGAAAPPREEEEEAVVNATDAAAAAVAAIDSFSSEADSLLRDVDCARRLSLRPLVVLLLLDDDDKDHTRRVGMMSESVSPSSSDAPGRVL